MTAIELRGVTKRYERLGPLRGRSVTALHDVDLTVRSGEIFGFLGPNGAGKSTTIDLLLDYAAPTEGTVRVLERDVATESAAIRQRVGVLPDGYGAIGERTGREHLEFAIDAKDAADDPDALLERVGMHTVGDYPVEEYSKGMAQRLMLAVALVGEPDLLILDEPSTGLDPNGARTMRRIVREENERGATVFFSSHIMEQVEAVCDRVAILDGGELVAVDTIDALRDSAGGTSTVTIEVSSVPDDTLSRVRALEGVTGVKTPPAESANGSSVVVACTDAAKAPAIAAVHESGADVRNVTTDETSLEELFENYTRGVAQ
ncbi:ABC transporter ATP-binding protein [Natronorubrum daqingense]|uniref:ABC-2 type transport system ATP-binding protein n=1 Tax=Natronorubrum daqingense TaxID=588898 RepID=A0A1N7F7J8_9EURY|nr:ABC transporter ATP-binding protein [Natronorubrum daqingense]APX97587.1 copper ABC transporter ATP-binding protein [Natronorubrum daqingense]SIR96256.1 ABC-2 type transport system ATP-binding protein [Natronorubrum daqingense]